MDIDKISPPPQFSDDLLRVCRENDDPMPLVIPWCDHIAAIAAFVSGVVEGPTGTTRERLILAGVSLRCAKLLLAITEFAQQKRFGEVIPIVARSLFESAIKLGWMSAENTTDAVNRFVAFGLRTERQLETFVRAEIARNGLELPVERRMLDSIDRTFRLQT